MIRFARLPLRLAYIVALTVASRIGAALEVHEAEMDEWAQVRADMKQALKTELVEWREMNLDAADVESDFERWDAEVSA